MRDLTPPPPDMEFTPEPESIPPPRRSTRPNRGNRLPTFAEEFGYLVSNYDELMDMFSTFTEMFSNGTMPYVDEIDDAMQKLLDQEGLKDPTSVNEAINHPKYGQDWKKAIKEEIQAMLKNDVLEFVPRPNDKTVKPVRCGWVFTYKLGPHNEVLRCKARLVGRGYSQRYGLDYKETFAAVAKLDSIRFLFSVSVVENLFIHHMDVKNAFLSAPLEETIYSEPPEEFLENAPAGQDPKTLILLIKKSLYGLKQAGRNWYMKLHNTLIEHDFIRFESDHAVYLHPCGLLLAFWVDDILLIHKSEQTIASLKQLLVKQFSMTDLGELHYFLNLRIIRRRGSLFISQQHYVEKVIDQYKRETLRPVFPSDIPIKTSFIFKENDGPPHQKDLYMKYVGCLMYIMRGTRADIAYALQKLSQYCSNPSEEHHEALNQVFRYLLKTRDYGILMTSDQSTVPLRSYTRTVHETEKARKFRLERKAQTDAEHTTSIYGYSDANFASDLDRLSIDGNVFFHHGNLVSWASKKQPLVALSTQEAEYAALSTAARQAIWLRQLHGEAYALDPEQYVIIQQYCDNQSAIRVSSNPEFHARTKHYDIHVHFIR